MYSVLGATSDSYNNSCVQNLLQAAIDKVYSSLGTVEKLFVSQDKFFDAFGRPGTTTCLATLTAVETGADAFVSYAGERVKAVFGRDLSDGQRQQLRDGHAAMKADLLKCAVATTPQPAGQGYTKMTQMSLINDLNIKLPVASTAASAMLPLALGAGALALLVLRR